MQTRVQINHVSCGQAAAYDWEGAASLAMYSRWIVHPLPAHGLTHVVCLSFFGPLAVFGYDSMLSLLDILRNSFSGRARPPA